MSNRKFEKVNDMTFKVEETKTAKDTIEVSTTLNNMAQIVGAIAKVVAENDSKKEQIKAQVKWYNMWVDILSEAKASVKLAFKVPEKIELGDGFTMEDIDITKLPKMDIKMEVKE